MDAAFVEGLIRLFERSSLAELEYGNAGGDRLRLVRGAGGAVAHAASAVPAASPVILPVPGVPAAGPASVTVSAGLHGVFYRGPGPGLPPFVQPGDAVEDGQVLAILDAMKVLNRVEAEQAGRIVAVLAQDGEAVVPGAPLFTLEPAVPGNDARLAGPGPTG